MKLNSVMIFSEDPKSLTQLYKKVLNMDVDWTNGEYSDFETGGAYLEIGPHSEVHGKMIIPRE